MGVGVSPRGGHGKWREVYGHDIIPGSGYPVGAAVQIAPMDLQVSFGLRTVRPTPAAALGRAVVGLVADEWATGGGRSIAPNANGFDGNGGTTAPGTAGSPPLGTNSVPVVVRGYHMRALIDNTNGTAAVTHGYPLSTSSSSIGKLMAGSTTGGFLIAEALLAATGPFTTLGAGALTAATQNITVGGAPAAGDIYQIPVQIPFNESSQGVAQYRIVTVGPLTTAQAASTTTAAAAIVAAIAADPVAGAQYTATNAANVVTLSVVPGMQFRIGNQGLYQSSFYWGSSWELTSSGTVGNSLTLGALTTVIGGGTLTASGAAANYTGYPNGATLFAGGAGYVGTCPVFVGAIYG